MRFFYQYLNSVAEDFNPPLTQANTHQKLPNSVAEDFNPPLTQANTHQKLPNSVAEDFNPPLTQANTHQKLPNFVAEDFNPPLTQANIHQKLPNSVAEGFNPPHSQCNSITARSNPPPQPTYNIHLPQKYLHHEKTFPIMQSCFCYIPIHAGHIEPYPHLCPRYI
jgi:hypothetical protein